ncbi:acyloxyacyl hydrolase [Cecembia lonarensis]|uniref:Lipid A 3-O-deacylase (PagL) n=1 Tax=Cecembia lonarensis (strain CCUG 58316 / KCTC 22772 / LW9) TaxID=1225176 RepID=K1L218_CECL9|nr:acyloxyacyl hydrolase [Cecembia lonarensis]EKB50465.1 Lipid A 3-O-deacylase (PagL) [Cecembia lonarensis LW9]
MRFYLIIFLLLFSHLTHAQFNSRLNLESSYGFIIPHSPELRPFAQNNPYGFNLNFQMMGLSEKKWSACNCFHYLGLQLSHYNFSNREILGTASSLSGTFEPSIWRHPKWTFSVLTGMGVTYLDRVFNEKNNPDNVFFSSNLSFLLFLTPRLAYTLNEQIEASISLSYNHISNGGQRQPNKGINFPMLGFGISYYLKKDRLPQYFRLDLDKELSFFLEGGLTTRRSVEQEARRPTFSLVLGAVKPLSAINGIGGGIELNKDYSLSVNNSRLEALMPSPYIAHHFLFGRFDFSQRIGVYTQKPIGYVDNLFYQRYILKYRYFKNLSLGISLKAHGHVAENIDLRLGWAF